jgi:predicted AAA+ superfamily ATPase
MIKRQLFTDIQRFSHKNKAIIVLGPRQVGKTTLIKTLMGSNEYLYLNGDDNAVSKQLSEVDTFKIKQIIGNYTKVFVDEAQKINNIGNTLKIITDQMPFVELFISGSSSLEMNQVTQEPFTGRKFEFELYPISWKEFENHVGYLNAENQLEHRLIYGMYPDVLNDPTLETKILKNLAQSYLYQDILALAGIRKPDILDRLLMALALQIGNEVSYNELAQLLQIDKGTVMKYIDLLEQSFIIFTLPSFSRKLRNEIKNNRKIYFYDNGIRNAIINNFNGLEARTDKGALWENFLISERRKQNAYTQNYCRTYFWRTQIQQEIDYLEESNGEIRAFEFKWNNTKKFRYPATFANSYESIPSLIDKNNFREFIG